MNIQKLVNELTAESLEKNASQALGYSNEAVHESLEKIAKANNGNFGQVAQIAANTIHKLMLEKRALEKSAAIKEMLEDMSCVGLIDQGEIEKKACELMEKSNEELGQYREVIKMASRVKSGGSLFEEDGAPQVKFAGRGHMFDEIF